MSNIVLKGDVVQNLGEYLPNVYIERIQVSEETRAGFPFIDLNVFYSILFLIDDNYNIEDIKDNLLDINFFCSFSLGSSAEKKKTIIEKYLNLIAREAYETPIDFVNGSEVVSLLNNNQNYQDNLYDQEGRRILKISGQAEISQVKLSSIKDNNFYFYVFSSLLNERTDFQSNSGNSADILFLNTSNFAYEKIFSPGLNVLRDEELIYLDSQGAKYGQVPLLGLNRQYYKTTTVTREEITSKVNTLVRRFDRLSEGPLSDSVAAIKYVLSTQADTENLLVELDKVRRSFPNKTNNNPVGNLYASYTKLLQNINSAFLPSEVVTKERYLTGKVFDLRTGLTRGYEPPEPTDSPSYIPEGMFFIHRERKSADAVEDDLGINRGMFFIRYEEMLKRMGNIGKLIDINKLYETVSDQDLDDLKRILFSYFRVSNIQFVKFHKEQRQQSVLLGYGTARDNRSEGKNGFVTPSIDPNGNAFAGPEPPSPDAQILREYNYAFENPSERMLCYQFLDLDKFSAIYEENEIEINGGMNFKYEIYAFFQDDTNEFITYLINKFDDIKDSLDDYTNLAKEICSYNNIDNRFNDFFVNSVREQFPTGIYPWESAPAIYAVMAYVLTTNFETFEDAIRYSKNVTATISPENGSLESLVDFRTRLDNLRTQQITALEEANDEPSGIRAAVLEKEVFLRPLNYVQLLSEADAEFESLLATEPIRLSVPGAVPAVTRNGVLQTGRAITGLNDGNFYYALYDTMQKIITAMNTNTVATETFQEILEFVNDAHLSDDPRFSGFPDTLGFLNPLVVFFTNCDFYFKTKRNASLIDFGLGYYFEAGETDQTIIESDAYLSTLVTVFISAMEEIFDGTVVEYKYNIDTPEVRAQMNTLAIYVMDYYRLNTDKLMYDINYQRLYQVGQAFSDFNLLVATAIRERGTLTENISYTGPELNEIAGYEDIVVRDN
jgi:hypothetical protein